MVSSVEIIPCEWNEWCTKNCTNRNIMRILGKDGLGSYVIERPIEDNLDICVYYTFKYNEFKRR